MRVTMNLRQLRSLESDKAGPSSKALEFPGRSSRCAKCHCASFLVLIQVNGLAALTGNNIFPRKSGFRWMGLLWAGACWPDFVQILSRSSDPCTDPLFPSSIAIASSVNVLSPHCAIKILHPLECRKSGKLIMQVEKGFNEICRTQVRKHCQTLLQVDYALNRCIIRMGALQAL